MTGRRGEKLREHILWTAKDVFLESGFERTSMDVVAQRAETSKRSLYAHFPSKDALFAGVVALTRELYLNRLGAPETYADEPAEAVARYCGRMLQLLLWTSSLRTLRMGIAEAERVPEIAAGYYEAIFEAPTTRLAAHISEHWDFADATARDLAESLVGRAIHPEIIRCLLGVRMPNVEQPEEDTLADAVDLDALRATVREVLGSPRQPARL